MIQECNLHKVPFTRPKFTWSKGKGSNMILERLDKGLANEEWFNMFHMACETHLMSRSNDQLGQIMFFV